MNTLWGDARRQLTEESARLAGKSRETIQAIRQELAALEARMAQDAEAPAASPAESGEAGTNLRVRRLSAELDRLLESLRLAASPDGGVPRGADALGGESVQAQIVEAQEGERRRLAREIHDGPAQVLANAIFEIQYCERLLERDPAVSKRELAHLEADLREGLTEVRRFIFDLHDPSLVELGLETTLRRYAQHYQERSGISVELDLRDLSERLSPALEVTAFRVIQEALQNVQKHAATKLVRVSSAKRQGAMVFAIADEGRGFDAAQLASRSGRHMGIVSMRQRAELVHGELDICSSPGKGTRIGFSFPVVPVGR
jgi:two-component system, NarL family, sensor histidine kinase DegS